MSFDDRYLGGPFDALRRANISVEAGLDDSEGANVERKYGFQFPLDLRQLLQFALPVSEGFPNWRSGRVLRSVTEWKGNVSTVVRSNLAPIEDQITWPVDSICLDVERNDFWWEDWGAKSTDAKRAIEMARENVSRAPILIPVCSHRYLPAIPCVAGNPVFSVYQSDVIYYGSDVPSYFANEFKLPCPDWALKTARKIPFWSELAEVPPHHATSSSQNQ